MVTPVNPIGQRPESSSPTASNQEVGRCGGHDYQLHSPNQATHVRDAQQPQLQTEAKTEELKNQKSSTLFSILTAPMRGVSFTAQAIGHALQQVAYKMKLAHASIFSSLPTVLAIKSQPTGEKAIRELLKGRPEDAKQFEADFHRGSYSWNNFQIDERAISDLKERYGEAGFKNMSLLMVQSLSGDIAVMLNAQYGVHDFGCPVRIKYQIREEGDKIVLTAPLIFTRIYPNDESGNKTYSSNFIKVERQITMSREDFMTNWTETEERNRVPSLQVKDVYSQDISAKEVAPLLPKGGDKFTYQVMPDNTIEEVYL